MTEETLPIVKYYHQHRLLKHTHHHHQQQQRQRQQQMDEEDDDDNKGMLSKGSRIKTGAGSPAAGARNKEKFYYTPHLSDQVFMNVLLTHPSETPPSDTPL